MKDEQMEMVNDEEIEAVKDISGATRGAKGKNSKA